MGRIISPVRLENATDGSKHFRCDALVDTGASHMILPAAWKGRLGDLPGSQAIELETATQKTAQGEVCGPVKIELEGFRPIYSEVIFLDMQPEDGQYEPLIGYLVLEQSLAAVDTLGHRLVHVKRFDLK